MRIKAQVMSPVFAAWSYHLVTRLQHHFDDPTLPAGFVTFNSFRRRDMCTLLRWILKSEILSLRDNLYRLRSKTVKVSRKVPTSFSSQFWCQDTLPTPKFSRAPHKVDSRRIVLVYLFGCLLFFVRVTRKNCMKTCHLSVSFNHVTRW